MLGKGLAWQLINHVSADKAIADPNMASGKHHLLKARAGVLPDSASAPAYRTADKHHVCSGLQMHIGRADSTVSAYFPVSSQADDL